MDVIIDTHSFIWYVDGDPRLSKTARTTMSDGQNRSWLSVGSLWELAIKIRLGRLASYGSFSANVRALLDINGIEILEITLDDLDLIGVLRIW